MTVDPKIISETLVPYYIRDLKPYQAGKPVDELAREKGLEKISKLASNENPLGPSPKALEAIRVALGSEHDRTAVLLNNLGDLARQRGDYGRARELFEEAPRSVA